MTPALRASARYWLTGLALACVGVAVNRLLAPAFPPGSPYRSLSALTGQLVALAGLLVIMLGIRARVRRAQVSALT